MAWDYKRWGTIDDPIHKSDLNAIAGDYGCLRSFRYSKDATAEGRSRESETECNGRMVSGTATHETIARALSNPKVQPKMLELKGDWRVDAASCQRVYDMEMAQAVSGRQVHWYEADDEKIATSRAEMIAGVLNDMKHHVKSVRLLEAGFIVKIGGYWFSGHTDLIHEPFVKPGTIALADWKTGQTKPNQISLDHSWESGVYSAAMRDGLWIAREHVALPIDTVGRYMKERVALEAELIRVAKAYTEHGELPDHVQVLGQFPSAIHYVHLADYVPYQKAGKKEAKRFEELQFYGLSAPGEVKYTKGQQRGPAWYEVRRTEDDIPRLESLLRNVVGTIRMGRFFESVGEKCNRCPHQQPCLNSGYELRGESKQVMDRLLKQVVIEDDGLGEVG